MTKPYCLRSACVETIRSFESKQWLFLLSSKLYRMVLSTYGDNLEKNEAPNYSINPSFVAISLRMRYTLSFLLTFKCKTIVVDLKEELKQHRIHNNKTITKKYKPMTYTLCFKIELYLIAVIFSRGSEKFQLIIS